MRHSFKIGTEEIILTTDIRKQFYALFLNEAKIGEYTYKNFITGISVELPKIGEIQFRYIPDKKGFSFLINGLHHKKSVHHPKHELKVLSIPIFVVAFTFIGNLIFTVSAYHPENVPFYFKSAYDKIFLISFTYYILTVLGIFTGAILCLAAKRFGIILSLIFIGLDILLLLYVLFTIPSALDFFSFLFFAIKLICIGLIIKNWKVFKAMKDYKNTSSSKKMNVLDDLEMID